VGGDEQRHVKKPWGHEVWWARTDHYAGKILFVEAGHQLSLQLHREKDETSYPVAQTFTDLHSPNMM
jgi:mannose-6-phosphate isomerase